jgi:hypothetical protein
MTVSDITGALMTAADPRTDIGALRALQTCWQSFLAGRDVRVALVDGEDPRVIAASARLTESGTVVPYLVGRRRVRSALLQRCATRCGHPTPKSRKFRNCSVIRSTWRPPCCARARASTVQAVSDAAPLPE